MSVENSLKLMEISNLNILDQLISPYATFLTENCELKLDIVVFLFKIYKREILLDRAIRHI
jgi:hypothetical protein